MADTDRRPDQGADGHSALVVVGAVLVIVGLVSLGDTVWAAFAPLWAPFAAMFGAIRSWVFPLAIVVGGALLIVLGAKGGTGFSLPTREARLYRSTSDKMVSGVLGGLAEYLSMDPTLLRVVYALLALVTQFWTLALLYVVAAIIVPVAPPSATSAHRTSEPDTPGEAPQ